LGRPSLSFIIIAFVVFSTVLTTLIELVIVINMIICVFTFMLVFVFTITLAIMMVTVCTHCLMYITA